MNPSHFGSWIRRSVCAGRRVIASSGPLTTVVRILLTSLIALVMQYSCAKETFSLSSVGLNDPFQTLRKRQVVKRKLLMAKSKTGKIVDWILPDHSMQLIREA